MILLKDILYRVAIESVIGDTNVAIQNIDFDSRKISLNDVFVAIRGEANDGHEFIAKAEENGAIAIVCEELPAKQINGITYVLVENSKEALAMIANNFYQQPSGKLKLVGVTGTNGKTTISSLLHQLFTLAGYKVGLISTIKIVVGEEEFSTRLTTPDSLTINKYLKKMNDAGVEFCFMEVSSHGIAQHRTAGLEFKGGIFTNLSHDHLDYHKSFQEYRDVKKKFFDELPKSAFAITNSDDKNGAFMLQNTKATKKTYALKTNADYRVQIIENELSGLLLKINNNEVWSTLIGNFNAYNLGAIYAAADLLGLKELENLKYISQLKAVSGRFQYLISAKENITAIVDYAHTPDALQNVLETINAIRTKNEELITVVGCGGDRDATKRPIMGKVASDLSTKVIFTSDNPRTEDPDRIIEEVEAGVEAHNWSKIISITNRKQAIKSACAMANTKDIILIAGKGHETYQEVNGVRSDFDDIKIVQEMLEQFNK
ncbi:UDP-N-acetylmuramoyl-L-alanyl-D-glutamate--2,6-diaminopimelate ligase [Mesonia sp. MT50]|uniref:UDP-N-acetylmuramoyl-L-alanyl-D-glutamate--2,6-diaminopimelate ligase n=1 Tax=Mesonia profundi TaxID=3070998 RepID=A0ABU1A3M2_9FLAO|nr:UDP-N-acetylmuramoyl-L-alanyl-D-glutamate--2,6-diaminopimelate ligase [Mesonia profundi]MDQ7918235.1 UDP-N-acetylmuramoyl-L-alanyl-D-glutamate--2,6-diaminopimelate ligase [Mesonia profundi]